MESNERDVLVELGPALASVACPCSSGLNRGVSVMDMGIVSSAHEHNGILDVTLQLTEPACIFGLGIAENVQRTLQRERGDISEVRVSFDYSEDVWTEERLSAVGRKKLELARLRDREADSDGSAINSRGEA